jgi:cardiolipin synthase A/B
MDGVLPSKKDQRSHDRMLANQALSRAAGAPLIPGNEVTLLKDAAENYPAWLKAIQSAHQTIYFECYIIRDDDQGSAFAEALILKAKQGVKVRLIYDWLGALGKTSSRYWRMLSENGIEVRCFNPPKFYEPFGWLSRDHRKVLCVDSHHGFVSGLCVGQPWVGDPMKGIDPWRDTGVEVRGPAVADIAHGFAESWATTGDRIPEEELLPRETISSSGNIPIRVVASIPNTGALYRLDQLVAAMANETLWLSDAYFMGTSSYVQALRAAAMDGVDVRLLVPGASDIGALVPFSRAGYRPLLEAGIRIFEWNGPMMHAKTAVADGRIARVGSSNLNYASWLGNWEMDVIVEDENFGHAMFDQYLEDLQNATEIVLNLRKRVRPAAGISRKKIRGENRGSAGRVAAGAIRIGNTVGAAIANRRALGPAEARVMFMAALVLAVLAALTFILPELIAFPLAVISIWVAVVLLYKSWKLRKTQNEPPIGKKESG